MWKPKWSRLTECLGRPQGLVLLLLPCLLGLTLYLLAGSEQYYGRLQYYAFQGPNKSDEVLDGYLVWNPKCHMLSKNPFDPSITKYVKKEKFDACSSSARLTSVSREANGTVYLVIKNNVAKRYSNLSCCWASVNRPMPHASTIPEKEMDSKINVGQCQKFEDRVVLPRSVDTLLVTCTSSKPTKPSKGKVKGKVKTKASSGSVYENVHAVLNPERVRDRLNGTESRWLNNSVAPGPSRRPQSRELSVLMLGIDSVSRLNFHRSMPFTKGYLEERGWLELRGYNKMGDNTFPNLMAFLTGQNQSVAYARCRPKVPRALDNCSLIWYPFREAGYVTAYGEDQASISTFNYLKVGFVEPPTDYYLRPYILASEKLLKTRSHSSGKYCTGPEISVDRIFDFAVDFAKTFVGTPYFGFFWTNGVSHENMNDPSSYDGHFLEKLQDLEAAGVMNDSLLIMLSDHGMRYGEIRKTFIGWYEERLPFIYISVPEWFREQEPEAYRALRLNRNRLTSPYDLYETLRDILARAGGQAPPSSGCPQCGSLFKPVPLERSCADAGVAAHWCTCSASQALSTSDHMIVEAGHRFVEHIDAIVDKFRNKKGQRLCSKLRLKKIHRVNQILDLGNKEDTHGAVQLLLMLEVTPGEARYETTIRYEGPGNFTIRDDQVSRINSYANSAKCLDVDYKQYCHCAK